MINDTDIRGTSEQGGAKETPIKGHWRWIRVATIVSVVSAFLLMVAAAHANEPVSVTTSALDSGASSELVSSVPVYATWDPSVEKAVYSLPIPSIGAGDVLRAAGNLEVTGIHSYGISISGKLVLGTSPSDVNGTVVSPWTLQTITPEMSHVTFPINGVYNATSNLGTRYLKLVVKAPAFEAKPGDTLAVKSNSGRLGVTRYISTGGPTSLPTHMLQPLSAASQQITSVPVDSVWRSSFSLEVKELSSGDLLDLSGQIGLEDISGTSVLIPLL